MIPAYIQRIDWGLLIPVFILVSISLATLASINMELFYSQFVFFLLSMCAYFLFSQVNYKILQFYAIPFYILSLLGLIIVLIIGLESRGAVRWIELFGIQVQLSEIIKPFFGVTIASFLASRTQTLRTLIIAISMVVPIAVLIQIQPDLGTAIIYFTTATVIFFIFGFSLRWFVLGFLTLLGSMPILFTYVFHEYQKQRVYSFLSTSADPLGKSYNAIQSVIAVGSGMVLGKGLGQSTQSGLKFLPERHTDFIFATLSEALGFVGSCIIVLTFAFLLYRIYQLFLRGETPFARMFTLYAFCLIFIQFFINVGMNVGLLPIVGVTLPFISYGGSSLLSNFILLGILSSIHMFPQNRSVLEIR